MPLRLHNVAFQLNLCLRSQTRDVRK